MKYLLRTIGILCISILLLSTGIASAAALTIGNYSIVSKTRISRTEYNHTYHADITNSGSDVQNVTATLTSNSSHTIVVEGTLNFGDIASGATVTSSNTFTIKQNRRYPLDWSDLVWDIQHESGARPLRIKNITPCAGLPGAIVTITFSGNANSKHLQTVLGSQAIDTAPVAGRTDAVTFQVAADAKSAPLYLKQGDRSSNSVWFSVSDISVVTPAPENVVLDELGNEVAVNLVLVSMKNEFDTKEEAQRVADLVESEIVGRIVLVRGYQLRLLTTTLNELRVDIAILRADSAVDLVMEDQKLGDIGTDVVDAAACVDTTDWCSDQSWEKQRDSNRVKQGADLYIEKVKGGEIRPLFTSIGIFETGVDFDAADFDGYGEKGTSRSNNIAIYAKDTSFYSEYYKKNCNRNIENHGITVTGVIAAELNDADQDTGKNAGLLAGLLNHGSFNICVQRSDNSDDPDGKEWASGVLASTNIMLEAGASVINWSIGVHKSGARRSNGNKLAPFGRTFCNLLI